jgi:hypothetical protein
MSSQKDIINILREIRGTALPGQVATDGIWYELTQENIDGNPGIYGDMLAKYNAVNANAPTLMQAIQILENLNIEVEAVEPDEEASATLDGSVWRVKIPKGMDGEDGQDGHTPVKGVDYKDGVDGITPTKGIHYVDGTHGRDGIDGEDGLTPQYEFKYNDVTGNLEAEVVGYTTLTGEIPSEIKEW